MLCDYTDYQEKVLRLEVLKELLNEKGIEESEKYHGLKRFLKDFSVIHDKELIEVELWEKYLMYAIVFGETKKIVKQMGLDYPDCDSFFLLRYNFK